MFARIIPLCVCLLALACGAALSARSPAEIRRNELMHMLKHDCGSCHGMQLKGGLGRPLPAQLLRYRAKDELVATILNGRPGTAMPPWRALLSQTDAEILVDLLQTGEWR